MKNIFLFLISSFIYCADPDITSLPELVTYINNLTALKMTGYCVQGKEERMVNYIKLASFDPSKVVPYYVGNQPRFGMCNSDRGVHIIVHYSISKNGIYSVSGISECR